MGVPLGNVGKPTQASININAWAAYRLGSEYQPALNVFGPSVTFGNVGL